MEVSSWENRGKTGSHGWPASVMSLLFTAAACKLIFIPWEEQILPSFGEIGKLMIFENKIMFRRCYKCLLLTNHCT